MNITDEVIQEFAGADMEIHYQKEGYFCRGPIENIFVVNNKLYARFAWLARLKDGKWVNDNGIDYSARLEIYEVSLISGGRLSIVSQSLGEVVILYPKNGNSRLDPAKVEGLILNNQKTPLIN